MKKLIAIFALLATVGSVPVCAQETANDNDILLSLPKNRIHRQPCVLRDDSDAANARRYAHATQATAPLKSVGSPEILVCLAEFSDTKFSCGPSLEAVKDSFEILFNGKNQKVGNNIYSVREYFEEMSFGKFTPHFNIVTGVTVDKTRAYYASGNNRVQFRDDVLTKLSPMIANNVSQYDSNKDGKVDAVIVVFPGYGNNIVGDNSSMHPCCWPSNITNNNVTYATPLIGPELYNQQSNSINTIGVFVHEMSHMLGLPDFYDNNYKGAGMDYWSLMDYGEYWKDGTKPTPYTAFERNFMGWLDLEELKEPTTIENMKSVGEGGKAYIIYNEANRNEYYIIENLSGSYPWISSLCSTFGSGLIIYHVDLDSEAWIANKPNDVKDRQCMTIVPANGHFEIMDDILNRSKEEYLSEMRGHLYPLKNDNESIIAYYGLKSGNNQLTDEQRTEGDRIAPAATLYNANTDGQKLMHKPITEISYDYANHTASFKFMGGKPVEDAIDVISVSDDSQNVIYNLTGQRISSPRKGINIINGKKVMR